MRTYPRGTRHTPEMIADLSGRAYEYRAHPDLLRKYGLSPDAIVSAVRRVLGRKSTPTHSVR